jgi:CrcB protein
VTPLDPDLAPAAAARGVTVAVVAAGGVIGALGRYALAEALPHDPDEWPWATLLTNLSGAFLLAVLLVVLSRRFPTERYVRPLFGTGVLGGYTTFSTLSVDVVELIDRGQGWLALGYVVVSVAGLVAACFAGLYLARRLVPEPRP